MLSRQQMPAAVESVTTVLRLPRLAQAAWRPIYSALASHVAAHTFSLAETTRWARDQLVEADIKVGRKALGDVARGSSYGGCPLYAEPPPTADQIGAAFVDNVVDRARHADLELTADDVTLIREWFGAAG